MNRDLAQRPDELRDLQLMCREGRLYEVEHWIAEGKPIQLSPDLVFKGAFPKSPLAIAIDTGQHSLAVLLLKSGYRLELERRSPLENAILTRRWALVDLLMEWGADPTSVYAFIALGSYNMELYERFWAAGYDFNEGHAMAGALSEMASNRPLFGFAKRHLHEDPGIQQELNIALGHHAKAGNEKGVSLCLWAGADPHARIPFPGLDIPEDANEEDQEDFLGGSAIEEAARAGHLGILKRLRPDPDRDDFDNLYRCATNPSIVEYLKTVRPPKDLTPILSWHARWLGDSLLGLGRIGGGLGTIEALLRSGVMWAETDPVRLATIRKSLLHAQDYDLKSILSLLRKPEICALSTYQELTRTPRMQERLVAMGIAKKPISEREKLRNEIARLAPRYDRVVLYDQVWSQPVQVVARSYGVSGVALAKACRKLRVPVPPRGYWARVRNGVPVKKPPLPKMPSVTKCHSAKNIPLRPDSL